MRQIQNNQIKRQSPTTTAHPSVNFFLSRKLNFLRQIENYHLREIQLTIFKQIQNNLIKIQSLTATALIVGFSTIEIQDLFKTKIFRTKCREKHRTKGNGDRGNISVYS